MEKHPSYTAAQDDWELLEASYAGESAIKAGGTDYLPATQAMEADGMGSANALGQKAYEAYKTRAVYPGSIRDAVTTL